MAKKNKELINKIGKAAYENERKYPGCSQAVLGAFREVLGDKIITDEVFKAGCALCGGVGNTASTCGAIIGGTMVISLFTGRDIDTWDKPEKMFDTFQLSQKLINFFKEKYWSQECRGVQEKIFGRAFNTNFEDELEAFEKAGGHTEKCPQVVRDAAIKTMEILIEAKLINADNY